MSKKPVEKGQVYQDPYNAGNTLTVKAVKGDVVTVLHSMNGREYDVPLARVESYTRIEPEVKAKP